MLSPDSQVLWAPPTSCSPSQSLSFAVIGSATTTSLLPAIFAERARSPKLTPMTLRSCRRHDTGENVSCHPVVNADVSSLQAVTTLSAFPWDLSVLVHVLFRYGLSDCCVPVSDISSRRCPRLMLVTYTGNMVTPDLHWLVIDIPWHAVIIISPMSVQIV